MNHFTSAFFATLQLQYKNKDYVHSVLRILNYLQLAPTS